MLKDYIQEGKKEALKVIIAVSSLYVIMGWQGDNGPAN